MLEEVTLIHNKFLLCFSCLHVPFKELGRRMGLGEYDYCKAHITRQETKRRTGGLKGPCRIKAKGRYRYI